MDCGDLDRLVRGGFGHGNEAFLLRVIVGRAVTWNNGGNLILIIYMCTYLMIILEVFITMLL